MLHRLIGRWLFSGEAYNGYDVFPKRASRGSRESNGRLHRRIELVELKQGRIVILVAGRGPAIGPRNDHRRHGDSYAWPRVFRTPAPR